MTPYHEAIKPHSANVRVYGGGRGRRNEYGRRRRYIHPYSRKGGNSCGHNGLIFSLIPLLQVLLVFMANHWHSNCLTEWVTIVRTHVYSSDSHMLLLTMIITSEANMVTHLRGNLASEVA